MPQYTSETETEEHSLESRKLYNPANIVGVDSVFDGPLCQLVPLIHRPAIYGQSKLRILVFALFQIFYHLLHVRR